MEPAIMPTRNASAKMSIIRPNRMRRWLKPSHLSVQEFPGFISSSPQPLSRENSLAFDLFRRSVGLIGDEQTNCLGSPTAVPFFYQINEGIRLVVTSL